MASQVLDPSWDSVVEEMIYCGLKSASIMRIINQTILAKNLTEDFVGTTTVWKKQQVAI